MRKIPELAKIHSNCSGERNEKKEQTKTCINKAGNLSTGLQWEKDEPSVEGPPKCF